nr:F0F1 ATP synthase subunit delta [Phycisphaerae bacterium]
TRSSSGWGGDPRLELIHALWRAYVLRLEDARGQIEVQATSAVELDAAQRAEIERLAAQLSGRKPLVQYIVNPDVIGGLVLRIGDYRYDHSLRRHLNVARHRLLERTNRAAATA